MPRPLRIDFPGAIHHVSNSGAKDSNFFIDKKDRNIFCSLLAQYAPEYELSIYAFALMSTHFHLAVESHSGRLSAAMKTVESEYARIFNSRHGCQGHFVERRFFSELVEDGKYFANLIAYILTNPHRAGLVESGELAHPWTSLSRNKFKNSIIDWEGLFDRLEITPDNFHEFLRERLEVGGFIEENRIWARRLKAIGSESFFEQMLEKKGEPTRLGSNRGGPIKSEEILADILGRWNFNSFEELKATKRDRKYSSVRYLCFYLLKVRSHLSVTKIGKMFEVTAMAVSKGIKKFRKMEKSEKIKEVLGAWGVRQV